MMLALANKGLYRHVQYLSPPLLVFKLLNNYLCIDETGLHS